MEFCRIRTIDKLAIHTPLLLPSFSSRGFPQLSDIHRESSQYITDCSLVSAYDLYYGYLDYEQIYASDVLFIDSGGYEALPDEDPVRGYCDARRARRWTLNMHVETLQKLSPASNVCVVSFDSGPAAVEQQLEYARLIANVNPRFAVDVLIKADPVLGVVSVDTLVEKKDELEQCDIIGVTEKELGNTVQERCDALLKLRQVLDNPIHLFGCLEPQLVLLYYLCGADVFDGLSWIRFAYNAQGLAVEHASAALANGDVGWNATDWDLRMHGMRRNIEYLRVLQRSMSAFASSGHEPTFEADPLVAQVFRDVLPVHKSILQDRQRR